MMPRSAVRSQGHNAHLGWERSQFWRCPPWAPIRIRLDHIPRPPLAAQEFTSPVELLVTEPAD
jgi:hypothetical protein